MQHKSATELPLASVVMPMITLYEKPDDYPNHYVARLIEGIKAQPTQEFVLYDSLDEARKDIWQLGLIPMMRDPRDLPCIVETYI